MPRIAELTEWHGYRYAITSTVLWLVSFTAAENLKGFLELVHLRETPDFLDVGRRKAASRTEDNAFIFQFEVTHKRNNRIESPNSVNLHCFEWSPRESVLRPSPL